MGIRKKWVDEINGKKKKKGLGGIHVSCKGIYKNKNYNCLRTKQIFTKFSLQLECQSFIHQKKIIYIRLRLATTKNKEHYENVVVFCYVSRLF